MILEKNPWLTIGERRMVAASLTGLTPKAIALTFGHSPTYVKTTLCRVYRKYHVHNQVQLVNVLLLPPDSPLRYRPLQEAR